VPGESEAVATKDEGAACALCVIQDPGGVCALCGDCKERGMYMPIKRQRQ